MPEAEDHAINLSANGKLQRCGVSYNTIAFSRRVNWGIRVGDVYGFEYWPLVIFSSLNIVVQEILSSNKTLDFFLLLERQHNAANMVALNQNRF